MSTVYHALRAGANLVTVSVPGAVSHAPSLNTDSVVPGLSGAHLHRLAALAAGHRYAGLSLASLIACRQFQPVAPLARAP